MSAESIAGSNFGGERTLTFSMTSPASGAVGDKRRKRQYSLAEPSGSLVASYARLQLDLAGHVEDMIGLGVPDHRPARLTDLTRTLVTDPALALTDTRSRELTYLQQRRARIEQALDAFSRKQLAPG